MPGQENCPLCRTPSRSPECGCGSGITKEAGQLGMEARPNDFQMNHANSGSLSSGSFCLQNIRSTPNLYELETRSGTSSNRCVEPVMDENERLCLSSFCIDRQVPIQDSKRGNQRDYTHCTSMANSTMVCSSPINVVPETNPSAKHPSILTNHNKESHPLIHQLNLAAWSIPGIIRLFQAKQQLLSYLPDGKPQKCILLLLVKMGTAVYLGWI